VLGELLRQVRSARDTASLFEALGYRRCLEPAGKQAWVVARWSSFQVVASDAEDPPAAARAWAERMAAASRRELAVALGGNEMALAAPRLGVGGSTRVQRISLSAPSPFALRFLESLRPDPAANALVHALRLAEILSAEDVSDRFFTGFRQILERMVACMKGRGAESERRTAALLPLTRILFLYFVQSKGWLDGRPDYLRRLLDVSLGKRQHFHRQALNPLFFGVLNRPTASRSVAATDGNIPYLNGGLFQPHPIERRIGPVLFPNELWRDAFDLLFEKFRFCVREADETDAIAPDMLGKVFERVMDIAQRYQTGTFYTPETLVRQIVRAALDEALRPGLGSQADALLSGSGPIEDAPTAQSVLRALRVLDPAVGSGAFLLGALDRLTELRRLVWPSLVDISGIRRRVLAENLFGVDLSPIAVRLAELRLWLAVIADDPATDIASIVPLPNLDGVVRQGDSLLDPIGAARACYSAPGMAPLVLARAASAARRTLFRASGRDAVEAATGLRLREMRVARILVDRAGRSVVHRLRDLAGQANSRDLFGRAIRLTAAQRRLFRELQRHRAALKQVRAALLNGQVPFFSFEVHAPDVMVRGGFDLVLGNPPWVRSERIPPEIRKTLAERFRWWRGSYTRGYSHLPDLSVAFLERGLELTAPGGVLAMLVPAKLASAGYGETARAHLVAETRLEYLHRVPARESTGFRASIYPLAVIARKTQPSAENQVRLGFHGELSISQRRLSGPGPWILVPDRARDAIEQLRSSGTVLADLTTPALGVKTGADDLFVGNVIDVRGNLARLRVAAGDVDIEVALLRPAIRGRDVQPFCYRAQKTLIWTHGSDGAPEPALPPHAQAYFHNHSARLRTRADYRRGPIWSLFRVLPPGGFGVVWRDIAARPVAVVIERDATSPVPLNTCYTARFKAKETAYVVSAVFNSVWCGVLARLTADEAQAGYRRINARVVSGFPIPESGAATDQLVTLSRQAHDHGDVTAGDLDDAVANALDLPAAIRNSLRRLAHDFPSRPSRRARATSLVPASG
jgi:hypothetical protein